MEWAILFFPARDDEEHAHAMQTIPHIVRSYGPTEVGMVAPADSNVNRRKAESHRDITLMLTSNNVPMLQHLAYEGKSKARLEQYKDELVELGITGVFAMKGWERMIPDQADASKADDPPPPPAFADTKEFIASLKPAFKKVCGTT